MNHYVDRIGRKWVVRELVEYGTSLREQDGFPRVVRCSLVFESGGQRRFADDVPPDWRAHDGALAKLFARATRVP
jgi:hypothetical protein